MSIHGVCTGAVQRGVMAGLVALALMFASPATSAGPVAKAAAPTAKPRVLLVMGDSLSAAYGLRPEQGWVALTAQRMKQQAPGWAVVNASISGETSAGGRSRILAELKRHRPAVVVIELGANDGLRGLPLAQTRANLDAMITAAQAAKAKVLLVGLRLPPNYGPEYTLGFERNFVELAKSRNVALLPFLLAPIASDRSAFQADNLHPVASAQPKLRDHAWPALMPLLK